MSHFGKIIISTKNEIMLFNQSDIIYCKSDNNYTILNLKNDKHIVCKSLAIFSKRLNPEIFFRVSQSYLININFITLINKREKVIYLMKSIEIPYTVKHNIILGQLQQRCNQGISEKDENNHSIQELEPLNS